MGRVGSLRFREALAEESVHRGGVRASPVAFMTCPMK